MASCESVGLAQVHVPYVFLQQTSPALVLNQMSPKGRDVSSHLSLCSLPSMSTTHCGCWKATVLFLRQLSIKCEGKCQVLHTGRSNHRQHYRLWGHVQLQNTLAEKDLLNKKLNASRYLRPSCTGKVQQCSGLYHSSVASMSKEVISSLFLPRFKSYV